MFKKSLIWLLPAAFALVLSACGEQKKAEAPAAAPAAPKLAMTKIVVGLDDNFPPMGFHDEKDNSIVGFDVDLAKEAAKRLGVPVEFKAIDWSSKEAELNGKRVDVLWNGLTITEDRKKNIDFTPAYLENKQIVVVKADSAIKSKADLAGKIVGTQEGSSAVEAIAKDPAGKTIKEVKKYPDNVFALKDLSIGRIEALVVDEIVGRYYMTKQPGQFAVLNDHFGTEEYGVGVRKGDAALLDALSQTMAAMKKDGAAATISQKWFGQNIVK